MSDPKPKQTIEEELMELQLKEKRLKDQRSKKINLEEQESDLSADLRKVRKQLVAVDAEIMKQIVGLDQPEPPAAGNTQQPAPEKPKEKPKRGKHA